MTKTNKQQKHKNNNKNYNSDKKITCAGFSVSIITFVTVAIVGSFGIITHSIDITLMSCRTLVIIWKKETLTESYLKSGEPMQFFG